MRAISLHQPWASLVALGFKEYETRSWSTQYRGKLLIHAAKLLTPTFEFKSSDHGWLDLRKHCEVLPLGAAVAVCNLTDCIQMTASTIQSQPQLERSVGDWQPGRYAWKLENIQAINPIPARGKQGLWIPDQDLIQQALGQPLAQAQ